MKEKPESWHKFTGLMTHLYNTSISRALNTSPSHVHYGINPSQAYPDLLDLLEEGGQYSEESYCKKLAEEIKAARKMATDIKHQNQYYGDIRKQFYRDHKGVRDHDFHVGSWVLVKRQGPRHKLDEKSPFMGPAKVLALLGRHVLFLQYLSNGYRRKRSASQCVKYFEDPEDPQAKLAYNGPERRNAVFDFIDGDDDLPNIPTEGEGANQPHRIQAGQDADPAEIAETPPEGAAEQETSAQAETVDLEESSGGEKTTLSTEVQPPAAQAAQATEQGSGGMKTTLSTEVTEPMPPRGQHTTAVEKDDLIDADLDSPGPINMMFEVTDMLDLESDEAQEVDLRNENGHNNNNVNELMDCPDNNVYDDEQPESDKFNFDLTGNKLINFDMNEEEDEEETQVQVPVQKEPKSVAWDTHVNIRKFRKEEPSSNAGKPCEPRLSTTST